MENDFRNATQLPDDLIEFNVLYTPHTIAEEQDDEELNALDGALAEMDGDFKCNVSPENLHDNLSNRLTEEFSRRLGHDVTGITFGGPSSDSHSVYIEKDGQYFATTNIAYRINPKYMTPTQDSKYEYPLLPCTDPETGELIEDPDENRKMVSKIPTTEYIDPWPLYGGIEDALAINRQKAAELSEEDDFAAAIDNMDLGNDGQSL